MNSKAFSWTSNFPYPQARPIQQEALQALEDNWSEYDVFVIQAPTAFGKTAVAKTLMKSQHSVSVITPSNLLVNQFIEEFPDTPTLSRIDSYYCDEWKRPCNSTKSRLLKFCKGCKCARELSQAKYKSGPGIYNYHTYLAHKLYRDVLVVDEAHNLLPIIQERLAVKLWQHDYKYPDNMFRPEQVIQWLGTLSPTRLKSKKIQLLKDSAKQLMPDFIYQRTRDWFNGKGTLRNEPEERDLIKLLPVDISNAPPMFWPLEVQKIVLMSATISSKDIERLGLGRKRVLYIECKSPISGGNRPIVIDPVVSVNRNYIQSGDLSQLVNYIHNVAEYHTGEKGIIHATYQLARLLQSSLESDPRNRGRFIFHDKWNKAEKYKEFRASDVAGGKVLVACGMYEGVDLPEDLGRWQIIAKVPWTSLANPAIKYLAEHDPEWFYWETWKVFIQACGRICRTPEDYGITYCPDATFLRLWREAEHMVPNSVLEALNIPDQYRISKAESPISD